MFAKFTFNYFPSLLSQSYLLPLLLGYHSSIPLLERSFSHLFTKHSSFSFASLFFLILSYPTRSLLCKFVFLYSFFSLIFFLFSFLPSLPLPYTPLPPPSSSSSSPSASSSSSYKTSYFHVSCLHCKRERRQRPIF